MLAAGKRPAYVLYVDACGGRRRFRAFSAVFSARRLDVLQMYYLGGRLRKAAKNPSKISPAAGPVGQNSNNPFILGAVTGSDKWTSCLDSKNPLPLGHFSPRPPEGGEGRVRGQFALLKIFRGKTGMPGNSRQHLWADFVMIVEGEDIMRPTRSGKNTMGATVLPFDCPTDAE
jgi:hypothetical protein